MTAPHLIQKEELMTSRSAALEAELLSIKGDKELVTAEEILNWSEKHRKSAWAAELEWNDRTAGREHRLNQIRQVIITLEITIGERTRRFYSLSIDRNNKRGGGYRDIKDILGNKTLYDVMLGDALAELTRLKEKYESLRELRKVWRELEAVKKRKEDA
jgi:hypothetical protein